MHFPTCVFSPEERLDEMTERKTEVAETVVRTGSPWTFRTGEARPESLRDSRNIKGEGWLTELSTSELKELFAVRREAVAR